MHFEVAQSFWLCEKRIKHYLICGANEVVDIQKFQLENKHLL